MDYDFNEKNTTGYYALCDVYLPQELHDYFSEYPLFPESRAIDFDNDLSDYQKSYNRKSNLNKLIMDLKIKTDYFVHIAYLQECLKLGYKIISIKSILKFYQTPWLKNYIDFNTEKRKLAKTEFERDQF